jgi:hypothetical protein
MPDEFTEALAAGDDETPGKGPKSPRRDAGTPISPRLRIRL